MSSASRTELDKRFDPQSFEMRWYRLQEESGQFRPEVADEGARPFTLVIPPPNVTGKLHVGHALGRTLEDVLARWRRMQGRAVLWVPGVDHAGIATQMVVERDLTERTGKTRHDLGREPFLEICRQWADARRGDILNQIRRLGCSCDFSREYYTLDAARSKAVRRVFSELYHQGLAYRDSRMVNWCPRCATVLSDLEVNHVESSGLRLRSPGQLERELDVGEDREPWEEGRVLEQHGAIRPRRRHGNPVHQHLAAIGSVQAREKVQQR